MRIQRIASLNYNRYNTTFERKLKSTYDENLNATEEQDYHNTLVESYKVIGANKRAVITHGSVYPALKRDTYIGSPFGEAAKVCNAFYYLHGFNNVQLGPIGQLQASAQSPYTSSAFAKNELFIDLGELTKDKYANILSNKTYLAVTEPIKITEKNYTRSNFDKAYKTYKTALNEAFENFKIKTVQHDPKIEKLNKEYQAFIAKHDERLTDEGIFKVLAKANGKDGKVDENFENWNSDLDKNLIVLVEQGDKQAFLRYNELLDEHSDEIDKHKFEQFIITKQIKENQEWRKDIGLKFAQVGKSSEGKSSEGNFSDDNSIDENLQLEYINDLLVGCSNMDEWRYKDAFLSDWEMGAIENAKVSQRWHIPVIDPKKIFLNDKYELGRGGKLLKEKIDFALEHCENVRVDHVMGLIEPYLMSKQAKDEDFITNPPSMKNMDIEKYISMLKDKDNAKKEYDEFWDYPKLLEHLVIPTFKKHGLDTSMPVWEDICSYPDRFKMVYEKQLNLPKISNLDWSRAENQFQAGRVNDWFMLGSHDNIPVMNYLKRQGGLSNGSTGEYTREDYAWNSKYLAGYLNMDDSRENIGEIRQKFAELYETNDKERIFAKFAELMTTPKFQISFDDFWGITEEGVVYNIPGSDNAENWTERLTPDCIDKYYENLSGDNPTAINVPETLRKALQCKIDKEIKMHNFDAEFKKDIYSKCQPLLDKLDHYTEVLKERE